MKCIASPARIRWALLRSPIPNRAPWQDLADRGTLTMGDARQIADAADIPLAALYLPEPSPREMALAWVTGQMRRHFA